MEKYSFHEIINEWIILCDENAIRRISQFNFLKQVQCKKGVYFKGTFGEDENDLSRRQNLLMVGGLTFIIQAI